MNLHDRVLQFNHLCNLIRRKATGTPGQLAKRIQVSRGTLYKLLKELESYGAEIEYDCARKCFYFEKETDIEFKISKKDD